MGGAHSSTSDNYSATEEAPRQSAKAGQEKRPSKVEVSNDPPPPPSLAIHAFIFVISSFIFNDLVRCSHTFSNWYTFVIKMWFSRKVKSHLKWPCYCWDLLVLEKQQLFGSLPAHRSSLSSPTTVFVSLIDCPLPSSFSPPSQMSVSMGDGLSPELKEEVNPINDRSLSHGTGLTFHCHF